MTTASAQLSNYRQSPRKVRLVATLVKGKTIAAAIAELTHLPKRAAPPVAKLIKSAVANAKSAGLDEATLRVKTLTVDKGPIMKRMMPRAHGRGFPIHKHTSHLKVVLEGAAASAPTALPAKKTKSAAKTTEKKTVSVKKTPVKKK